MARSPAAEIMRREWNEGVRGMLVFQAMSWGMPGGAGGMGGERVNPPMVNTRQHHFLARITPLRLLLKATSTGTWLRLRWEPGNLTGAPWGARGAL